MVHCEILVWCIVGCVRWVCSVCQIPHSPAGKVLAHQTQYKRNVHNITEARLECWHAELIWGHADLYNDNSLFGLKICPQLVPYQERHREDKLEGVILIDGTVSWKALIKLLRWNKRHPWWTGRESLRCGKKILAGDIDPLVATFIWGKIKIYFLKFLLFLDT